MAGKLLGTAIQSGTITSTQLSESLNSTISAGGGGGPKITSLIYPGDDTAANTVGGQTIYVNGSGFQSNVAVYINSNAAPSTSFISSSNVSFTTPALSAATYPLYLVNTDDGGTAILVPGLEISGDPSWSTSATLPEQGADDTWNISLSATSDSNVSYTLAGGSSLPSGISLAANGLISGTMSSPPASETTYNFTVVATDEENQDASRAFSINVTVGEGVPFANTVLLIHADGTNNQNNHTFLDSSNNNFTITRNGNATQGSFSPFSQTGWSGYFDGTGDWLTFTGATSGSGNFTVEAWVNLSSLKDYQVIFDNRATGSTSTGYAFGVDAAGKPYMYTNNGFRILSSITIPAGTWNHLALVRNGTTITIYVNGVSGGTYTSSANFSDTNNGIGIAPTYTPTSQYFGYISNLRVVNGTALYTENFTPPTASLTNIANTSLLTLQSNRFVDNSNNNFTITRNGDVRIVPYSPFAPTSKYTTAAVGGSAYFDGNLDYLSIPSNASWQFGSGDFTIEAWVYINARGSSGSAFAGTWGASNRGWIWFSSPTSFAFTYSTNGTNSTEVSATYTIPLNTWTHLASIRSGNTVTQYVNGVAVGNGSVTGVTIYASTQPLFIGHNKQDVDSSINNYAMNGYISDFRILKGTALYTSNFTPPTAPLTNIANTSLLCNFTNAGIFDSTAKNVFETVGDAKVNTSVVKYGTGSMYFDGTGDWLKSSIVPYMVFGSSDMTVEAWIYPTIVSGIRTIFDTRTSGVFGNESFTFQLNNNNLQVFAGSYSPDNPVANAGTISANTWSHVAFSRNSGNNSLFINGTRVANNSLSWNQTFVATNEYRIGQTVGIDRPFNGYIDDLRISRFARYTSNFTPPTAAFKDR